MKDFYVWGSASLLPDRCYKKDNIVDIAVSNLSCWRKEELKRNI